MIKNQAMINTGMDSFVLIDSISSISEQKITGEKIFYNDPFFAGLESLAQLCALHVRYNLNYKKHAFLLKIASSSFDSKNISGTYSLSAELKHCSTDVYQYHAALQDAEFIKADLLIGTVEYSGHFNKNEIQEYYRKITSCLLKE
jgi:hypothetical protein